MPTFALEIDQSAPVDHEMNNVMVDGEYGGLLFSGHDGKWHWGIDRRLKGELGAEAFHGAELTREAAFEAFKAAWLKR